MHGQLVVGRRGIDDEACVGNLLDFEGEFAEGETSNAIKAGVVVGHTILDTDDSSKKGDWCRFRCPRVVPCHGTIGVSQMNF